ncbi:dihydrofolate reductase, partial [Streptomyces sp. TRM76130]|nr:dihydrofolate reductase [Streptomyces sp. TRM76130]
MTLLPTSVGGVTRFVREQRAGGCAPAGRLAIRGRRVVVVGAGAVGSAVARLLEPFGCELVRVARSARGPVTPGRA